MRFATQLSNVYGNAIRAKLANAQTTRPVADSFSSFVTQNLQSICSLYHRHPRFFHKSSESDSIAKTKIANLEEDSRASCTATKLPSYVQLCHPPESHLSRGFQSITEMISNYTILPESCHPFYRIPFRRHLTNQERLGVLAARCASCVSMTNFKCASLQSAGGLTFQKGIY